MASVRWLKVMGGFTGSGGGWNLGALPSAERRMRELAADIGGKDDAMAVYLPLKPDPDYGEHNTEGELGHIVGLVWLDEISANEELREHGENEKHKIGLPVKDSILRVGRRLWELMDELYGHESLAIKAQLQGHMQARPVCIDVDEPPFKRLADDLTEYYHDVLRGRVAQSVRIPPPIDRNAPPPPLRRGILVAQAGFSGKPIHSTRRFGVSLKRERMRLTGARLIPLSLR